MPKGCLVRSLDASRVQERSLWPIGMKSVSWARQLAAMLENLSCQCQPATWCLSAREGNLSFDKRGDHFLQLLVFSGAHPFPLPALVRLTWCCQGAYCLICWRNELPCVTRLGVWKCQAWVAFLYGGKGECKTSCCCVFPPVLGARASLPSSPHPSECSFDCLLRSFQN